MKQIKVGLIGFGRAGKAIANVLLQEKGFSLEWAVRHSKRLEHRSIAEFLGIDSRQRGLIYSSGHITCGELLEQFHVDYIIDFSSEEGVWYYGEAAARNGVGIISAISHYAEREKAYLKELSARTVVFWSPNITLGINYLMVASKMLKKLAPSVDIVIVEEHFKGKKGVSGTAVKIARALDVNESSINTVRAGGIVGRHEIIFGFPYQTVRLIHESISREAFGSGAVFAARELRGKPPGYYRFEDLLLPFFGG